MEVKRIVELKNALYKCETQQEVHTLVTNTISKYGGDVVSDNEGAEKYFREQYLFSRVYHNNIINVTLDMFEGDLVYGLSVSVTEHFIDRNNCVYSYDIDLV